MIEITPAAAENITRLLEKENNPDLVLRTFVSGGGCSGFQYGFMFDDEHQEGDWEFEMKDRKLVVDAVSMNYLSGAIIDFKEDAFGSQFTIKNPNASASCGCGNSFAV